jgi:flagellar FliL protein
MSDEAKKEKKETADASGAAAGGGASKLGPLLAILNLLLTLGIGGVIFMQFQKDKHREAVADIKPDADKPAEGGEKKEEAHGEHGGGEHGASAEKPNDKLLTLDQFTVNLSTSSGTPARFARVVVAVELSSSEASSEMTSKMAPARNAIIDLFNSKRPADLQTGEGRNFLKEEIKNALNGLLVTGKVKGVFFSNFAVSS